MDVAQRRRVEQLVDGWLFFVLTAGAGATAFVMVALNLIFGSPWTLAENAVSFVAAAVAGFFAYQVALFLRRLPALIEVPVRVRRRAVLRYSGVLVFQLAVLALVCGIGQVIHSSGGQVYQTVVVILAFWLSREVSRPFKAPSEPRSSPTPDPAAGVAQAFSGDDRG